MILDEFGRRVDYSMAPQYCWLATSVVLCAVTSQPSFAEDGEQNQFRLSGEFRYRFEYVDQASFDRQAYASNLHSHILLATPSWYGFSTSMEVEDIRRIGSDHFNDGVTGSMARRTRPIVPDPQDTEVNQAYLQLTPLGSSVLRYGRQRLDLNNGRYVGNGLWRMNEQTFDAFSARQQWRNLEFAYAYIWNVNRTLGDSRDQGNHHQDGSQLFSLNVEVNLDWHIAAYGLYLNNDDVIQLSNKTLGARIDGLIDIGGDWKIPISLEFAQQRDAANQPVSYTANYLHASAGMESKQMSLNLGLEQLGGDNNHAGAALQTPLATLHSFNGWADKFTTTPSAGLSDLYFSIEGKGKPHPGHSRPSWRLTARYHDFSAAAGDQNYGRELDLRAVLSITHDSFITLKLARFKRVGGNSKAAPLVDTTKAWLMLSVEW